MQGMNHATGVLSTLALLFKHGKREDLLEYGKYGNKWLVKNVIDALEPIVYM